MKLKFETGRGSLWIYDPDNCISYHICIDDTLAIVGPLTAEEVLGQQINPQGALDLLECPVEEDEEGNYTHEEEC